MHMCTYYIHHSLLCYIEASSRRRTREKALEFSMKSGLPGGCENVPVQISQVIATRAVQYNESLHILLYRLL